MTLYTSSGSKNCLIEKTLDKVNFDREHLARKDISREQAAFKECAKFSTIYSDAGTGGARGATGPPNIWQIS